MKVIAWIIVGILIGAGSTVGFTHANDTFRPHQIVDRKSFLEERSPYDQVQYLIGLADAVAYIRPADAIGASVSKCLEGVNVHGGMIFSAPMMHFVKQAQPDTPVVAVLLDILRKDCAKYLK